ncbi:MAG: hypothetical protein BroJett030_31560 [Alphaproteobacteria bacterium]|nr:MAG: hypothetical protein BroJett030_31560 [Alphaproteobacteria bacterium]
MNSSQRMRSVLGRVGGFFVETGRIIEMSRQASALAAKPEGFFRARGTTRDEALRDLFSRM